MNLLEDLPPRLPKELIEVLLVDNGVRIERILSMGHASPDDFWYDQDQNEWVLLLQGAARLQFEDRTVGMKPGDWIYIAAGTRHRVAWTKPDEVTIWLAVHYG